ncbi:RNA ligase 1-like [Haliotis asinina]|uniref:RNA ligase 1-like n=1 Tax=Haliotis asinina TaxID=109174 RepID=UPI0035318BF2
MNEQRTNPVQQKVKCLFKIKVEDKASEKRQNQQFLVVATDKRCNEVEQHNLETAVVSEKIDGTCCYIAEYEGKPWLWARHDRKPNKSGDRKLKKYLSEKKAWSEDGEIGDRPTISWDIPRDFKEVPSQWIPALEVSVEYGVPQPDEHGHIPGWVPVGPRNTQHKWHLSSVDLTNGLGLVLRQTAEGLSVDCVPLTELLGNTVELIGTNINGNPYKIGNRRKPLHFLVVHGSMTLTCPQPPTLQNLTHWFRESDDGQVEGIVWHCETGALFKLHRHHVGLPWPIDLPHLSKQRVRINVDGTAYEFREEKSVFYLLSRQVGSTCEQLSELHDLLYPDTSDTDDWVNRAKSIAPFVVGAVALPVAIPVALSAVGFGAGGIVAGSLAARAMSVAAVANGGGVAAGSLVAVCQSVGAVGLSASATAAASSAGVAVVGAWKGFTSFLRRNGNINREDD